MNDVMMGIVMMWYADMNVILRRNESSCQLQKYVRHPCSLENICHLFIDFLTQSIYDHT